jgi:hypothetical protein
MRHLHLPPLRRFEDRERGNLDHVLRKLLWTALYGVLAALATLAARVAASRIWRVATGEEPPTPKKR